MSKALDKWAYDPIVDNSSRKCLAIHVDHGIKGEQVIQVMTCLKGEYGRVPERNTFIGKYRFNSTF